MGVIRFHDFYKQSFDIRKEVFAGLRAEPKHLSPKFFYDQKGSALFEQITQLPEYYLTRCELAILEEKGDEIVAALGTGGLLVEIGSGSGRKTRLLLDGMHPRIYMPMDISREFLLQSAEALAEQIPTLEIDAVLIDFSQDWQLPTFPAGLRPVAYYSGSSIGNFDPESAISLLRKIQCAVAAGGGLLIATDLQKPADFLEAAYDDAQGVTAEFNRNILAHINERLKADFDPSAFVHKATYNHDEGRIEMHLRSQIQQTVEVAGERFVFRKDELLHTENCYKYTVEGFQELARAAGFTPVHTWFDTRRFFCLHYLVA